MTADSSALTAPMWRSWILQAAALPLSTNEHPWLCCHTYNAINKRVFCLYSPDEYREECSKNSFWETRCEKIPLKEIIAIARNLKINSFAVPKKFTDDILLGKTDKFEGTPNAFVNNYFDQLEAECAEIQNTVIALENMCTRSQQKKNC